MTVRRTWFMASISLGILLNPLNSSMISVAIAKLQSVYQITFTDVSWMIFAFYISSAIAQPVMGKVGDLFGRKKVFLAGLIVVFITSMFAPLSPNYSWLIGFRVLQSIGTSMIAAVGMAMVRIYITERQAGALSVLSVFLSGASAFGPSIGGFLIHWWNWPAIFLVNIPFIVASFVIASWTIPKDNLEIHVSIKMSFRTLLNLVDGLGILLFCVGMVGILIAALSSESVSHYVSGVTGLIAMGLFVWRELRTSTPFIPLRSFGKYPTMTWVHFQFVLVNILYYSLFFGLPTYLQEERHLNVLDTGFLMLSLRFVFAGRFTDSGTMDRKIGLSASVASVRSSDGARGGMDGHLAANFAGYQRLFCTSRIWYRKWAKQCRHASSFVQKHTKGNDRCFLRLVSDIKISGDDSLLFITRRCLWKSSYYGEF